MKRSEAVKLIEDALYKLTPNWNEPCDADDLLKELEEMGMAPPLRIEVDTVTELLNGVFKDREVNRHLRTWEAE